MFHTWLRASVLFAMLRRLFRDLEFPCPLSLHPLGIALIMQQMSMPLLKSFLQTHWCDVGGRMGSCMQC